MAQSFKAMKCGQCESDSVVRSRRESALDFFLSMFGLVPYRCLTCFRRWRDFRREQDYCSD